MTKRHRIDEELKCETRPVKGQPRVREVVGCYRPVEGGVGGPYVIDDGANGRESPKMTEAMPYLTGDEHMRILTGKPRAKIEDRMLASSMPHEDRQGGRRRGRAD